LSATATTCGWRGWFVAVEYFDECGPAARLTLLIGCAESQDPFI
jgi:hypothetical protein